MAVFCARFVFVSLLLCFAIDSRVHALAYTTQRSWADFGYISICIHLCPSRSKTEKEVALVRRDAVGVKPP